VNSVYTKFFMKEEMYQNKKIAWRAVHRRLFEANEVRDIRLGMSQAWEDGLIDDEEHDASFRKVAVQSISTSHHDLTKRITEYVFAANQGVWNFHLQGVLSWDPPQFLLYNSGGHYDWHIDHDAQSSTRKLTFVLQLSEEDSYEGGDISFFPSIQTLTHKELRPAGTLIIFPVYVPHRITPILEGVRHALIGWVHGDSFR
jgi:predicted 2-oxoglutarate/Fe(II)-dependent dioxygenase YbiX